MFVCLFFGDSLALGTAAAVNALIAQPCEVRAVKGAASTAMLLWRPSGRSYDTAILSIGSNDDIGASGATSVGFSLDRRPSAAALTRIDGLRRTLSSRRIIWLLPYERTRAAIVQSIAATYQDEVLDLARFPSRDRVHPVSYRLVARALLR